MLRCSERVRLSGMPEPVMDRARTPILVVTGASGVGKTTAIRALESRGVRGVRCHFFDSIGVPSEAEMIRDYGGPEQWQKAKTHWWIDRLAASDEGEVS